MALINTVEEMVNHRSGGGGSVVANHRGAGRHTVVVTTLKLSLQHIATISGENEVLSPEFGTKFQRQVPSFAEIPKFPHSTV